MGLGHLARAIHNKKHGGSDSDYEYSFDEYMYYIVEKDKELKQFFEKIFEMKGEKDKLRRAKRGELVEELVKLQDMVKQREQEARDAGINITDNYKVKCNGLISYTRNNQSYALISDLPVGINGANISLEMLKKDGNPYEEEYLQWEESHKGIYDKFNSCMKEKKRKFNIIKFMPLLPKKTLDKLWESFGKLEEEEQKLAAEACYGSELKRKSEVFANLTDDQKQKAIAYLSSVQEFEEIGKIVFSLDYEIPKKDRMSPAQWCEFALELIETGEISKEELEHIEELLFEKRK